MFLSAAFPAFKKKQLKGEIPKEYVVFKTQASATISAIIVTGIVGFANVFTIIEPLMDSPARVSDTLTMVGGPLLFALAGFVLFTVYEKKHSLKESKNEKVVG